MKFIVSNIRVPFNEDLNSVKYIAINKIGVKGESVKNYRIVKESVDARHKSSISMVYSVLIETDFNLKIKSSDIRILDEEPEVTLDNGTKRLVCRPIIVGTGPAGLFAGLILAKRGYMPLIIERGEGIEKREELVKKYWSSGSLDVETNVAFGEGGAGTFSDGKLTTRINDKRCDSVLNEFYKAGAPEEILYKAHPHIGSDILGSVVSNIRKTIIQYGGEIKFKTKMTGLKINDSTVQGIYLEDNILIDANVVILAIGHSSRDTFSTLHQNGVSFEQKPFSIGVRIEHHQEKINQAQYGILGTHPRLGAADYQLFCKTGGRTAYSFCMCPGGIVVASASEQGMIVTNGMSEYARARENANSALVVSVAPGDYGGDHPLAGIEFQRHWEKLAYAAGGSNNSAPVQKLGDFLIDRRSNSLGNVKPSYTGQTMLSNMNACLPSFVTDVMKDAIRCFDRKLKGFGAEDAILTGVETRNVVTS